MVYLNGKKTSGMVKLLLCIQVTCSILLLQTQRDEPCAKGQRRRGKQSAVRRRVGQRMKSKGRCDWWLYDYVMVCGGVFLVGGVFFYFEGVKR